MTKLARLKEKQVKRSAGKHGFGNAEDVDLSGEQLKRWVVNLSKYKLNKDENDVLKLGLNFCPTATSIPVDEFIVATEKACWSVPTAERDSIRAKVVGALKTSKLPKSNINRKQRDALKNLAKNKDILVIGADKGKATVILDKDDYETKLQALLDDEKTYEKLDKDPTPKYKRKLVGMLSELKKEEKITAEQYKYLYPTTENVPRVYATPKIHKPNAPLRPIVDYTGSIGYATSRSLSDILSPLVGNTAQHVKNSQHLSEAVSEIFIEENENFLSHDVISLFTNVPIPKALDIVRRRLNEDSTLKNRTKLSVDDIMDLLEFILTTTYMTFRGQIYNQKFGTAMGSPVSPIIANIVMEHLEQLAIATAPIECKPRFFKRYVDDILEIITRGQEDQLTEHLNQVDDTGSLKFTYECEQDGKIPFLDTLIVRKPDGSVKLLIYRKPTHTNQYLNFQSAHPLYHKLGVIRTLLDRNEKVVTEEPDRVIEESTIKSALKVCGYPEWSFNKVKKQMSKPKAKVNKKTTVSDRKSATSVTLPYIQGVTESVQRILRKHNISSAVRPHTSLKKMLVHPKDKLDSDDKAGVVYEIPCANCKKTYIGETGRKFGTRKKEHKTEADKSGSQKYTRSARKESQSTELKSSIAEHALKENHVIKWEDSKIIARDETRNTRWIRESIWIRRRGGTNQHKHLMNGDEGAYQLSHLYDTLIQRASSSPSDDVSKQTSNTSSGSQHIPLRKTTDV